MKDQVLMLPCKPPNGQEVYASNNWYTRKKKADEVHELVAWMAKTQHLQPVDEKVDIHITGFKKTHLMDSDNIWSKGIIDGLKLAGILLDDSPKYVGIVSVESVKHTEDMTLVMIAKHYDKTEDTSNPDTGTD